MTPRAAFFVFLLASMLCLPRQAGASCYTPEPGKLIRESAVIFKGKAAEERKVEGDAQKSDGYNTPDSVILFDVSTVYKGPQAKQIEIIQMRDMWGSAGVKVGHEYIIFADAEYKIYNCAPIIDMTAEKERREKWYAEKGYELRDNLNPMPGILDAMKAEHERELKDK